MDLITVKELHVAFGSNIVIEDVSFTISQGDILAIVGPNGAGKTVLIRTMLGLVKPTSGEIVRSPGLKVGYAPQKLDFDRDFPITVYEFIMMQSGGHILYPRVSDKEKVAHLLEEVGASGLARKKIGQLSGGQMQRVLIAASLSNDPDVVFLDEPSAGVDIGGEQTIYHLLDELHRSRDLTLVIVSHDIDFVYREANRVLCLNKQKLCYGIPEKALTADILNDVFKEMATPYRHHHEE